MYYQDVRVLLLLKSLLNDCSEKGLINGYEIIGSVVWIDSNGVNEGVPIHMAEEYLKTKMAQRIASHRINSLGDGADADAALD